MINILKCLKEKTHILRDIHPKIHLITVRERKGETQGEGGTETFSEGDENFYLAFTSRFRAAEGPCPKEGRFNIRL